MHVNQTSYNRKVLLSGQCRTRETKAEIRRIVAKVTNVEHVWNELQVAPISFQGAQQRRLHHLQGQGALIDGGGSRQSGQVVTGPAWSTFGLVARAGADAAIEIAHHPGVKKVVNIDGDHQQRHGTQARPAAAGQRRHGIRRRSRKTAAARRS